MKNVKFRMAYWQVAPFSFLHINKLCTASGQSPVKEVCEHIAAFFIRAATCFTSPLSRRCRSVAPRFVSSRRFASLASLDEWHRLTDTGRTPGVRGGWSRRFRTDSQGKVSWSIVPALVSFINVIPVYEMRGLSYLLGFLFSNLLSAFVSAYGTTGARIVPGIVNDCLQWKSTPKPRSL